MPPSKTDPSVFSHYWHVDSGPPPEEPPPRSRPPQPPAPPAVIPSPPVPAPAEPSSREPIIEEHAFRQTTTKRRIELAEEELEEGGDGKASQNPLWGEFMPKQFCVQSVRFKAHALGKLELEESQLDGVERSQAALNKAMTKLGNNSGKEMLLELDGQELRVLDAANGDVVYCVPMPQIRCWAVGRDNPRLIGAASLAKEFKHTFPGNLHLLHANMLLVAIVPYAMCFDVMNQQKRWPKHWFIRAIGCSINAGLTHCQAHWDAAGKFVTVYKKCQKSANF